MHKELLSDRERSAIKQFLDTGDFTDRMLKKRIKDRYPIIEGDFDLIRQAHEKSVDP